MMSLEVNSGPCIVQRHLVSLQTQGWFPHPSRARIGTLIYRRYVEQHRAKTLQLVADSMLPAGDVGEVALTDELRSAPALELSLIHI